MHKTTSPDAAGEPADERDAHGYRFGLHDVLALIGSRELGVVIGRAEHAYSERSYLLRYVTADGRLSETWWGESALEPVSEAEIAAARAAVEASPAAQAA